MPTSQSPALAFAAQEIASEVPRRYSLSTDRVDFFLEEGYLVLPDFCVEPELSCLRERLLTMFSNKVGHEEGKQFDMLGHDRDARTMKQPQILNPSIYAPELLRSEHYKKVEAIAKQLLGPLAQFSFDHSILKPADSRSATPWHQDEAHHSDRYFRYRQVSFWMPLQDTPHASGCMRYIPKSHLGSILPHRRLNDDPRVHAMECDPRSFDARGAVARPVRAGACILHDGRTLHSALPNHSTQDRLAYILAFIGPPVLRRRDVPVRKVAPAVDLTANRERYRKWLWKGGVVTAFFRRIRLGLRSDPAVLALKLKLLLRLFLFGSRRP